MLIVSQPGPDHPSGCMVRPKPQGPGPRRGPDAPLPDRGQDARYNENFPPLLGPEIYRRKICGFTRGRQSLSSLRARRDHDPDMFTAIGNSLDSESFLEK